MKSYVFFISLLFSSLPHAAVFDLEVFTRDTTSGLEWLDLTETAGRSYNSVSAELGSGIGLGAEGWRYATIAQFEQLLFNLGATDMACSSPIFGPSSFCGAQPNSEPAIRFNELLGITSTFTHPTDPERFGTQNGSSGILADLTLNGAGHWVSSVQFRTTSPTQGWYTTLGQRYRSEYSTPSIGSFLVRDATIVPVPAAIWLFVSAVGGIAAAKIHRRH